MVDGRRLAERRTRTGRGCRPGTSKSQSCLCAETGEEVARLRAVVEELAHAVQAHDEAVRSLTDALQVLTGVRHRTQ
jgi:hypothetical protein